MKRIFSNHSLNVFELTLHEWPYNTHTHNFCELIMVKQGSGYHVINDTRFPYGKGDIFLLTPEDHHRFEIDDVTVLLYIKFTEQVFSEKQVWTKSAWIDSNHGFLFRSNMIIGSIIKNEADSSRIFYLSDMLLDEFRSPGIYSRELMLELFGAIIIIALRHLSVELQDSKVGKKESEKINNILAFIRLNINNESKLTLAEIAEEFNISVNYIGEYLRTQTGKGFKNLVLETRLERASVLLQKSTLSISEIAEKTGFTDASHMNKSFKKYRNINPSSLRNSKK
ncbi:AraC family transcriptional regulator [Sphingobacterium puteale]|uniref:AraC family transcriptional regulator n=1 Tax=Sphingobacterium puteale TaxID=2420510 RepID=A0A420W0L8_9SPHI|nr:AraC family transcriptional regulator [Sphingobacterium puteale]RKO72111.1 AraC family transcriptional regulator [Sphingobacterium puteale]